MPDVIAGDRVDGGKGLTSFIGKLKKNSHLVEGEAQFACSYREFKGKTMAGPIDEEFSRRSGSGPVLPFTDITREFFTIVPFLP